ncbi:MAG: hypothetical protein QOI55_148 [Actinomycetota bacterium]|nr:hypothetical protein [Actinomycetota bacterium]
MVAVLVLLACAALGYKIGEKKGRGTAGLLLGLLLGLIGIIIIACLKPKAGYEQRALAAPPTNLSAPPAWRRDPYERHELRWWDGWGWTDHVSNAGVTATDSVSSVPAPPQPAN